MDGIIPRLPLIFPFLMHVTMACYPDNVNVSKLVSHYTDVCGMQLTCDGDKFVSFDKLSELNTKMEEECSMCSCDGACVNKGSCCVNVSPNHCESVRFSPSGRSTIQKNYFLVSGCPANTSDDFRDLCQAKLNSTNVFDLYPVTSSVSLVSYRNIYCAHCHNDTATISWKFSLYCESNFDINIFSSTKELSEALSKHNCEVFYIPAENIQFSPRECNEKNIVARCNMTGTWSTFDPDIKWACENTYTPYRVFANVFCYLCNSENTITDEIIISKCNSSGIIERIDPDVMEKCKKNPLDRKTFPYKNKYCQSCNTERTIEGNIILQDAILYSVSEKLSPDGNHFETRYNIKYLTKIQNILLNISQTEKDFHKVENIKELDTKESVNITNVFELVRSYNVSFKWCDPTFYSDGTSILYSLPSCSCEIDCIVKKNCCPDIAITLPVSCVKPTFTMNSEIQEERSYVLITHCPKKYSNPEIQNRCETLDYVDFYSMIPVHLSSLSVSFKNIYCFLCSTGEDIYNETLIYSDALTFWDIGITCPIFYDLRNFPSLQMSIDFSLRNNCTVRFMPNSYVATCTEYDTVHTCNKTGTVTTMDKDVVWLCEHFPTPILPNGVNHVFQNMFCELCNGDKFGEPISSCNLTGNARRYTHGTEMGCHFREIVITSFPYKNLDCYYCNVAYGSDIGFATGYRTLFSISDLNDNSIYWNTVQTLKQDHCQDGQVYDYYQDICREVLCSPGKYFKDGECVPLIRITSNLKYRIAFEIEKYVEEVTTDDMEQTLMSTKRFDSMIKSHLDVDAAKTEMYFVSYNSPCWDELEFNKSKPFSDDFVLKVLVFIQMFIPERHFVDRYALERRMCNLTSNTITAEIPFYGNVNITYSFRPKEQSGAWLLPVQNSGKIHEKQCTVSYISRKAATEPTEEKLYIANVNDILVCPQIELTAEEFAMINGGLTIRVHKVKKNFEFYKFLKNPDGSVRICLSDYIDENVAMTELEFAMTVFTNICTGVSLFCLMLTFIVYLIFPPLRSLPGLNIMGLVLSLFCAQLSFLLGNINDNRLYCFIIGICIHYFWLATFSFTNVCSFHMFRVFAQKSLIHSYTGERMHTFTKYCIFACLFPFPFIAFNLILNKTILKTQSLGYSGKNCFLYEKYTMIFTFILPFVVQMCANIVFFALTLLKLRRRPRVESTKKDQTIFVIYIKLFSITGITWAFQLIDGLFPISPFSFLVTFLNACQGLFIFMSYVCTKRVLSYWKTLSTKWSFTSTLIFQNENDTQSSPDRSMTKMTQRAHCTNDNEQLDMNTKM